MAKMLMGQIDHARNRIKELARLKMTDKPELPTFPNGTTILQEIRREERNVTPAILKKAFDRFVNQVPVHGVEEGDSRWNHRRQEYTPGPPKLFDRAPPDIETAIRDVLYEKEMIKALEKFKAEQAAYDKRVRTIKLKATETEDIIVLGDQHAALQALLDFEAFEVA